MNKTEILVASLFAIIGGLFLVVGIGIHSSNTTFLETALTTEAEIVDIRVDYDSDGNVDHDVFVEFEVNNKKIEGKLDTYNSTMYEGGTTTVYYDPLNPYNFKGSGANWFGLLFAGMGGLFFVIGIVMIFSKIKAKKTANELKLNGKHIQAEIKSVNLNTSYSVNGRHPYILTASYVDPETNQVLIFESANIWFDIQIIVDSLTIRCVDVYIDPVNPKKYFVDVENLRNHIGN